MDEQKSEQASDETAVPPTSLGDVEWSSGVWTRFPESANETASGLVVTAAEGSDYWRVTEYGFVHENGHGLLVDFPEQSAVEVSFICTLSHQFDQAGLLLFADGRHWIKADVEFADGTAYLGAVVTSPMSDWSLASCPEWLGKEVTMRVSRSSNAVTVRAWCGQDTRLVRVAPLDPNRRWRVGPMLNAPERAGLTVTFTAFRVTEPDRSLHPSENA